MGNNKTLKESTLSDVCTLVTDGTHDTPKISETGYPLVKAKEIVGGSIDFNECVKVSEEEHKKIISRSKPEYGDTLFAHIGASLGEAAYINTHREFSIKNVALFKPDKNKIDGRYLSYIVKSPQFQELAKRNRTGSAQPFLSLGHLRGHKIEYHEDLATQQKIASILSAFDELIENNTRRIAILEEMARLIYREWFVYFRYPGHENDKMEDSGTEFGEVPEGWGLKQAQDLIDFNPRTSIDKDKERPYLPMGGVTENSMVIDDSEVELRAGGSGTKFKNLDTLFARITPSLENGKTGFVQFLNEDQIAIGSTEFIVMRSINLNPYYVYCLARDDQFRETAIQSMAGASGRQRVRVNSIKEYVLTLPPSTVLNAFEKTVKPMFEEIQVLTKQNKKLKATRDLLLPRLISGKVILDE